MGYWSVSDISAALTVLCGDDRSTFKGATQKRTVEGGGRDMSPLPWLLIFLVLVLNGMTFECQLGKLIDIFCIKLV